MSKKDYIKIATVLKQFNLDLGNYFGFKAEERRTKNKIWENHNLPEDCIVY